MIDSDSEGILGQILEDLKFYAQMGLTVRTIELGHKALVDLQMRMYLNYGTSKDDYPTLFGIPVKVVNSSNPWARGYKFADTTSPFTNSPKINNDRSNFNG